MKVEGGCYCGAVRYEISATPVLNAQCHCRECQYISGGSPNVVVVIPDTGFRYTKGAPKQFSRSDLESPVTREFCAQCGTPLVSRSPAMAGTSIVKLGSLDQPAVFGNPQMAIFTIDQQPFHQIAAGTPSFERMPG
ncbi:MAG: GFA family protein [Panacagrimonas sp.]